MKRTRKLTKKQVAAIDAEREARLVSWERWHAQAHGKEFQAKVTAWDLLRGEGLVYVPDLNATFEIFACNLPGRKTWFPETACAFYMRDDVVQVRFDVQVSKTFVVGVTPAYIDQVKWESLDHERLSFRCGEDGGLITGLFAKGAGLW